MKSLRHSVCLAVALLAGSAGSAVSASAQPVYSYQVINQYPHDTAAFTQGLVLQDGRLFESTGLYGSSSLREVDLQTGAVIRSVSVPSQYFAEGMTIFQGKVFQVTWQSQTGFIYNPDTFALIGQFSYTGEGWGLTHDSQNLILSDGTNQIRFLDPVNFQTVRSIAVFDSQARPLTNINELEYINGEIYANIWQTNLIARIDPQTGAILGWIDLAGLLPPGTSADVLNGIAYDSATGHLLVTGKLWPYLFEIILQGGTNVPPIVTLTSPANGATLTAPATVALGATASDPDGTVRDVTFYANGSVGGHGHHESVQRHLDGHGGGDLHDHRGGHRPGGRGDDVHGGADHGDHDTAAHGRPRECGAGGQWRHGHGVVELWAGVSGERDEQRRAARRRLGRGRRVDGRDGQCASPTGST